MAGLGIALADYIQAQVDAGDLSSSSAPTYQSYIVQRGDMLSTIAPRYGLSWRDLYNANQDVITDPNKISVGMVLKIPSSRTPIQAIVSPSSGPRMTAVPGIPDDSSDEEQSTSPSLLSSPMFLLGAAAVALLIVFSATKKTV